MAAKRIQDDLCLIKKLDGSESIKECRVPLECGSVQYGGMPVENMKPEGGGSGQEGANFHTVKKTPECVKAGATAQRRAQWPGIRE